MLLTLALLRKISPAGAKNTANMNSIVVAVNGYGQKVGLDQPHRLAHFLAQLAHESGDFRYDQEIASGAAYEGRVKGLGNTQKGDGKKFKGRTAMQVTGRANYAEFTKWVRKLVPDAPDFVKQPTLINTDPYEGLGPLWYWDTRKLNVYADQNDIQMITRKINGGLNGYEDRMIKYDRAALSILGLPIDIKKFQADNSLDVDGVSGPRTRAAMHAKLVRMTDKPERSSDVQAAPVVAKEAVPVKLASLEGSTAASSEAITGYAGVGGTAATLLSATAGLDWKIVAIFAGVVMAGGIGYLIYKRWSMKVEQAVKVEAINARQL
jgi:putative chitinase